MWKTSFQRRRGQADGGQMAEGVSGRSTQHGRTETGPRLQKSIELDGECVEK